MATCFGAKKASLLSQYRRAEETVVFVGHADSRTTKLYDRRGQKVLLEDVERIRY